MVLRHPSTGARTGLRLLLAAALAVLPACSKHTTAPVRPSVTGLLWLKLVRTDANGARIDSALDRYPSDVRVRVLLQDGLADSFPCRAGAFRVPALADSFRLVVGPTIPTSDTTGLWTLAQHGDETIVVLADRGTLGVRESWSSVGAMTVMVGFDSVRTARLVVRALDGRLVRTLADRSWLGGQFAIAWDTRDDAGTPVPAGSYWITCEGSGSGAPYAAPNGARRDIVPAPGPPASPLGSRTVVRVLRD